MKFDFKLIVIPASIATKISRVFTCNQELVCWKITHLYHEIFRLISTKRIRDIIHQVMQNHWDESSQNWVDILEFREHAVKHYTLATAKVGHLGTYLGIIRLLHILARGLLNRLWDINPGDINHGIWLVSVTDCVIADLNIDLVTPNLHCIPNYLQCIRDGDSYRFSHPLHSACGRLIACR